MPDLPTRTERETELTVALLMLFGRHKAMPFEPYTFYRECEQALTPSLTKTFIESGRGLSEQFGRDAGQLLIDLRARQWVVDYAAILAMEISETTRKSLAKAAEIADEAERQEVIEAIFGEERAEKIAVTETTRASVYGERAAAEEIEAMSELQLMPIWATEADGKVCDVCGPLDGTGIEIFGAVSVSGPPAHPNCRCWLEWDPALEMLEA